MRRRGRARQAEIASPPSEQMLDGAFVVQHIVDRGMNGVSINKAYRRRPMIDTLAAQGILNADQHRALRHFRHHADMIDRSPMADSLCLERGGSGNDFSFSALNASYVTSACESAAGSLADILRAVVIYDQSLSQWAITRHGGTDKARIRKGRIERTVEPTAAGLRNARQDIMIAAQRVQAELDA